MDCEACTIPINTELLKVNGVMEVNTSYKNGNTIVKFDNSKTSPDSLSTAINSLGYKVIQPKQQALNLKGLSLLEKKFYFCLVPECFLHLLFPRDKSDWSVVNLY